MKVINKRIVKFIYEHHILTIATSLNNKPYCATCFYAYSEELNLFIFTSNKKTKHIQDTHSQSQVAGAIALETSVIGKIRGIQFTGIVQKLEGDVLKLARIKYLKRFPFAILKQTALWGIAPDFIKMTDNRLGFGKKLFWKQNE